MMERAEEDAEHVERLWNSAVNRLNLPVRAELVEAPPLSGQEDGPSTSSGRTGRGEWSLNGSATHRYYGNLNLRRDGLDVSRLMADVRDVAFSAGSACASGSGRPSHVLEAIGLSPAQARSSIRLGFGRMTTEAEIDTAITLIREAADRQRAFA